jgi:hypothetical protein
MPRPLYIICAASGALDQYTNSMSLFGLVESIRYSELRPQPDAPAGTPLILKPLSMRVVAAWLKEDRDTPEQNFETEFAVFLPGIENQAMAALFPPFNFGVSIHRLVLPEMTIPPTLDMAPGLMRIVNRVRRAGEPEWEWIQEYVILVEENRQGEVPPQATPAGQPADNQPNP